MCWRFWVGACREDTAGQKARASANSATRAAGAASCTTTSRRVGRTTATRTPTARCRPRVRVAPAPSSGVGERDAAWHAWRARLGVRTQRAGRVASAVRRVATHASGSAAQRSAAQRSVCVASRVASDARTRLFALRAVPALPPAPERGRGAAGVQRERRARQRGQHRINRAHRAPRPAHARRHGCRPCAPPRQLVRTACSSTGRSGAARPGTCSRERHARASGGITGRAATTTRQRPSTVRTKCHAKQHPYICCAHHLHRVCAQPSGSPCGSAPRRRLFRR